MTDLLDTPPSPRVVLVTGAARGLGAGISQEFSRAGAVVICADLTGAEDTVQEALRLGAASAHSLVLDVTNPDAVDQAITELVALHGRLDVIVNNAGLYTFQDVTDTSDQTAHLLINVNFFGVFNCSRAAARVMKTQGFGRIINMGSQVGKVARASEGIYAASKGAVILFTQALALELAPYGITANSICPGTMLTPMAVEAITSEAEKNGSTFSEEQQKYIDARIPVGRYGTPEDVGRLAVWLASDDASFITGSAQNLTGGEQVFF